MVLHSILINTHSFIFEKKKILLDSRTLLFFDSSIFLAFFIIITQTQILDFENVMHVLWYIIEF